MPVLHDDLYSDLNVLCQWCVAVNSSKFPFCIVCGVGSTNSRLCLVTILATFFTSQYIQDNYTVLPVSLNTTGFTDVAASYLVFTY